MNMVGMTLDDYDIIEDKGRKNQHRQYLVKCRICGHLKICSDRNLKKQDNHHSPKNCKIDYYNDYIGKIFNDYKCTEITYNKQYGYRLKLVCQKCGHVVEKQLNEIGQMIHSAFKCGTDYYLSEVGNIYGDYKLLKFLGVRNTYPMFLCECIVCKTQSVKSLRALKNKKFLHGTECLKAIPDSIYKKVIVNRFDNMNQRCNNPNNDNYKRYGGRGIKLKYKYPIDLYYDFIDEMKEYSKTHDIRDCTFDRINVNGDYEKDNLRIADQSIQSTNTRRKRYFLISNGKEKILSDNAMAVGRYLGVNGRAIGNVINGNSNSSHGFKLIKLLKEDELNDIKDATRILVSLQDFSQNYLDKEKDA